VVCPPASEASILDAESQLGHPLPTEQRALLLETDGVYAPMSYMHVIWPVEELIAMNLNMRGRGTIDQKYIEGLRPFEPLLLFGGDGMGNYWFVVRDSGRPAVYAWDHESGSRVWVARHLAKFLEWWQTGHIKF
jgi:hypothetical protein